MRIDSDAVETRSKLPGSARRVPRQDHRHRAGCIRLKREPSTRRPLLFLIMFIINARRVYGNRCPPIRDLSARPSRRNTRAKKKKKKKEKLTDVLLRVSPCSPFRQSLLRVFRALLFCAQNRRLISLLQEKFSLREMLLVRLKKIKECGD